MSVRAASARKRSIVPALAACVLLCATMGARAETIGSALVKIYINNPDLNERRASVRVRDEDVPKAAAGNRPRASLSLNGGPQRTGTRQPAGFDAFHNRAFVDDKYSGLPKTTSVSATLPLFDGFHTKHAVAQAESGVFAARADLLQTEQQALLSGGTAYMNVLRDTAVSNLRKNNIAVLAEQLRVTRDRQLFGEVTVTDVSQAEAALAQARSDYTAAQGALENSIANYVQIIGDEPKRLEPAAPLERLLPKSREAAIEAALSEHPGVIAALHQVDAAQSAVHVAESALSPTLSLGAQVYQQYDSYLGYPGTRQLSGQVFGQVNVPLYQGGGEYAATRQAKEQLGQARIHVDAQRNSVRAAVVQAYSQFTTARAAIVFNRTAVKAAETALRGVRDEAAFGQRTTYDVLKAQQDLLNARVNLVTAQRDMVVGSYAVLAAIGRLSVKSLELDAPAYDPAVHFDQIKDNWFGLSIPDGL